MADDDNFDIDIYGDIDNDPPVSTSNSYSNNTTVVKKDDDELLLDDDETGHTDSKQLKEAPVSEDTNMGAAADNGDNSALNKESKNNDTSSPEIRKKLPNKRKYPDDRPIDNGATTALYVADLHWWSTDDDIRGWVNACECEDELKDITFSEHKVNGKSKGYAITIIFQPVYLSIRNSLSSLGLCLSNSLLSKLQPLSRSTSRLSATNLRLWLNVIKSTSLHHIPIHSEHCQKMLLLVTRRQVDAVIPPWRSVANPILAGHRICHQSIWA